MVVGKGVCTELPSDPRLRVGAAWGGNMRGTHARYEHQEKKHGEGGGDLIMKYTLGESR